MVTIEGIRDFVSSNLGYGYGYGSGSGSSSSYGYGSGSGSGSGSGYISGSGSGDGSGSGSGSGYGDGSGDGYISDDGYGDGSGSGYGDGSGDGSGDGYGDGSGDGDGIKKVNGMYLYNVDGIDTLFMNIKGNIAKVFIFNNDFSLIPCYIVKEEGVFAHGETLHDAFISLQEKLYDNSTEDERIIKFRKKFDNFDKKYDAIELFVWHHVLTGSCKMGRESFCRDKGINVNKDRFTIYEFIELTKNSYGGEIIKKLL